MITRSEIPNSSFNYPKLRLWRRVGLFSLSLGCFRFCNPRLFKSWDYLNLAILAFIDRKKISQNNSMTPSELRNYPNGKKIDMTNSIIGHFFQYQIFPRMKSWHSMFFAKLEKPTFNQTPKLLWTFLGIWVAKRKKG